MRPWIGWVWAPLPQDRHQWNPVTPLAGNILKKGWYKLQFITDNDELSKSSKNQTGSGFGLGQANRNIFYHCFSIADQDECCKNQIINLDEGNYPSSLGTNALVLKSSSEYPSTSCLILTSNLDVPFYLDTLGGWLTAMCRNVCIHESRALLKRSRAFIMH